MTIADFKTSTQRTDGDKERANELNLSPAAPARHTWFPVLLLPPSVSY